ncbi:MAG TPA: ABC-F family ATP-binding cassette domain-containing protein [Candidatus Gemmiger faecavium]|nr:ABC-F family ATP-binding cassette domain-containing protein [Candidatus Gemmiger faecavium]
MLIELQSLGKSFGEHEVLRDVTASVEKGDRIGIIGANGTGKTTLLRVLCGQSLPDTGSADFAAGATCGYLEQTANLDPDATVYDTARESFRPALDAMDRLETLQKQLAGHPGDPEITAGIEHCTAVIDAMDGYNMDTQIRKMLNGMGFPNDTWQKKAGVLSGGEQTRLRLAGLLLRQPDILILDEPTNHLDIETMAWLETYLKTCRGAVLVVSHDRYFLDAVCTKIWELREKTIQTYRGNYSAYLPQRQAADERRQKQHDADVEKAAKLQDYIDRNLVRASTTKMAQSRRKQLEKLEITAAPVNEARELGFRFEYDIEPYDELVTMKDISIRMGERTLVKDLNYVVHRGDKLVIAGPNGTGKSTLLQVLDGKRRPSGGMVRLGGGARTGIFTQQQARRIGRVIDAIWDKYPRFTELEVRSHLARFGFRGEEVFKDCATLSGGELARLRFAELALERPNLMFLDEPTNHLDIYVRESLTQALAAYTGTLILVTHDRYLMQTLGCPILYLEEGDTTFYRDFAALRDKNTAAAQSPARGEPEKPQRQAYGKEQRRRRAEVRARIKAVETEIEELGAHIVELENELNDPEVLRDHLLVRDKCDDLEDTRFRQQELFDEWEKLLEEQERFEAEDSGEV